MGTSLITGGAGFIGSHLAEKLLAAGEHVLIMDDLSAGDRDNLPRDADGLEFVEGSILDTSALDALVARADRVFHLAAAVGVKLIIQDPLSVFDANVTGTARVLQACTDHARPVLLASSSEVYGKLDKVPFKEDDDIVLGPTIRSRWSYASSKVVGEFLAMAYFTGQRLPVTIARIFNTAGPRQTGRYGMVMPRFVQQALAGEPITVYGSGEQTRCFCHVDDLVSALIKLIDTPRACGEVVNLGGEEVVSIRTLAERIREMTRSSSQIHHIPFERAYESGFEDMQERKPDLKKAQDLIGFAPTRGLNDILADVIAYWRERDA